MNTHRNNLNTVYVRMAEHQRLVVIGTVETRKAIVTAHKNISPSVDGCHLEHNALQEWPFEELDALQLREGVLVDTAFQIRDKKSTAQWAIMSPATRLISVFVKYKKLATAHMRESTRFTSLSFQGETDQMCL